MDFRDLLQLAEAFGSVNRWFCSEAHCCEIKDPNLLLKHYIKNGGAKDFAIRYIHATGNENRWYCSQFYRREIRDPRILLQYYMKFAPPGAMGKDPRKEPVGIRSELSIAC